MPSPRQPLSSLLVFLIALGLVAGLYASLLRYRSEMRNRRAEIGIEWQEIAELANANRRPAAEVLQALKREGLTSVVFNEDTLTTLETSGEITPAIALNGAKAHTQVTVARPSALARIRQALSLRDLVLPPSAETPAEGTVFESGTERIQTPVRYATLRLVGLGLPEEAVRTAKEAHLHITARMSNFPGVNVTRARLVLERLRDQGASLVIFLGEEVLGFRNLEPAVAQMFRDPNAKPKADEETPIAPVGIAYGAVEFGKQKGDTKLATLLGGDYVRVHSVQIAEMGQLTEQDLIERYVRAVRDRNIRFCYVRLLTQAGEDPIDVNAKYLRKISKGIQAGAAFTGGDLTLGLAHRFADPSVSRLLFALIALGVAAGSLLTLFRIAPKPANQVAKTLAALVLFCVALAVLGGDLGRQVVALLAGVVYPTLACLVIFPSKESAEGDTPNALGRCFALAVRRLLLASLITSIGIVAVSGLLASRPFMLHTKQFAGIKAQHLLPLLVIAFLALTGGAAQAGESWEAFWVRIRGRMQAISKEPARFGVLFLGLVALVFLALVVARTGNDSGVGASGFEMKFRSLMDRVLVVRPRTKEFLIGHPALILGLALWFRGKRGIGLPLFTLGAIGQVSLLNTFCHIHTPLIISFWRDVMGIITGTLFGGVLFFGIELAAERFAPKPALQRGEP